jgi:orotate phosphoribosyltransferase
MISEKIAQDLLQIKAIKLSPQKPFTWASGLKSPIYCDNRMVLSYPGLRSEIIDAYIESARRYVPFDLIAGVATAGIAHGALIADRLELPMIYIRSEAKKHGMGNQIEGYFEPGQRAIIVEDLLSTGGSSIKAVEAFKEAGGVAAGVVAIFSYGFTVCTNAFAQADIPFTTITDYATLIRIALATGYINDADHELLLSWNQDPQAWSAAHSL